MDNSQAIHSKLTIHAAAAQIQKVLKISQSAKSTKRKVAADEVELLKNLCTSDNNRICQLASEAILQLTIEGYLELSHGFGILNMLLPNATPSQFITISGSIFELLLLDLHRRCMFSSSDQDYVCQFDLKPPQHPMILFFDKGSVGCMIIFLEKLTNALTHRDDIIRKNSVEFLRPVLLHLFANVCTFPESQTLWKLLVERALCDPKAEKIVLEILAWRRDTTAHQTCYTVSLLIGALETIPRGVENFINSRLEIALYLAAVAKEYIEFNYDPTRCFTILHEVCNDAMQCCPQPHMDLMLAIAADMLSVVSPYKIFCLLEVINTILPSCGQTSRMLAKEAMVQLLGQPTYTTKHLQLCDTILQTVEKQSSMTVNRGTQNPNPVRTVYYHNALARWTIVTSWWPSSSETVGEFLRRHLTTDVRFSVTPSQLHRAIFLSSQYTEDVWRANLQNMVKIMQHSEGQSAQCMIPLLYGLAQQKDARRRLHVLQTLASMGAKENVIGILKVLTKDVDRATCMDLYLRLWKAEPRTYPLLYDLLKGSRLPRNEDLWDYTIARAYTIREVCLIRPQQHGEDLVNLFSEVLSDQNNQENEVAICLSLDAISSLCENHVVNIVSTWKVLGFRFANERRTRVIKCLCRFFANVPLVKVLSLEQERLVNHIIGTLWHYVVDYEESEIIGAALKALASFNPRTLTLRQIPEVFRQGIELPEVDDERVPAANDAESVPPECWIQLIQFCNHSAIEAAGNLVAHHITQEMESFRGGLYQTPEGRPEPSSLKYLPRASILSTIVNYLIVQSAKFTNNPNVDELVLIQLLRIIAKPYPKPIPPLDWCFLHEYFGHCIEMRDACLRIAIKQMPYSGTARRLVENYLKELNETIMLEEELLKIYHFIGDITEAVQADIYKQFLYLSLQFLAERAEDKQFSDNLPFISAMQLISKALQKKYQNEDNFLQLCVTLENFFMRLDRKSKVFEKYLEVLVHLPEKHFSSLLKPSTWMGNENKEKLYKAIYLQFAFRKYNPDATAMHFYGLAEIITTVSKQATEESALSVFFLNGLFGFVQLFAKDGESGKSLINFVSELIVLVQCSITLTDERIAQTTLFMMDIFLTTVISFSGYGALYGAQVVSKDSQLRLRLFPIALITLFQQNMWREVETKIYEFLYHLYGIGSIPSDYAECFRNALLCCKKQLFFQQAKTWPKFVSMRKMNI